MKRILLAAMMICFIAAICTSCRQTNVVPTPTIVGKWTMETAIGHYIVMNNETRDTTHFTAADYFDFKADGTLSIVQANVTYNGKWNITNNKLFITQTGYIDYTGGFDIPVLTGTTVQLYYTETQPQYLEQTLNLTKAVN